MARRPTTRERLIAGADEVLRAAGVTGLTTRAVAAAAGLSEGTIYNYFADRVALIVAVIESRLPDFVAVLMELVPGRRTVVENLERVTRAGIAFERLMLPLVAGVAADPGLLACFKSIMLPEDKGPHRPHRGIAQYLEGEKALGRVAPGTDCGAVVLSLIGGWREAVLQEIFGRPPVPVRDVPRRLVRSLVPAFAPTDPVTPLKETA